MSNWFYAWPNAFWTTTDAGHDPVMSGVIEGINNYGFLPLDDTVILVVYESNGRVDGNENELDK